MSRALEFVLDDLREGLRRRERRRRCARSAGATTVAVAALALGVTGLPATDPTAPAEASATVLALSGCERDAFGCRP